LLKRTLDKLIGELRNWNDKKMDK